MPRVVRLYDVAAGVQLLERAIQRSELTLRQFAREELVRDEHTLRAYRRGAPMPAVVREKVQRLARRRRPPRAEQASDESTFEVGAISGLLGLGFTRTQAKQMVSAAIAKHARHITNVTDLVRLALAEAERLKRSNLDD